MNPLTLVKRIKEINSKEAALGISEAASWHAKYKGSPYVFVGGVPFDLSEGDVLAIFSQYGEIVDVNLVRDKGTGKSKGFAFVAYEDQRSTNLAVDNLNGASVLGRIIRVDHVTKYKKKEEEDEEMEQEKREARGVCRAFQRGDCNCGASCKFSHNEERAANTGWGHKDGSVKWGHDKHEPPIRSGRNTGNLSSRVPESHDEEGTLNHRSDDRGKRVAREDAEEDWKSYAKQSERNQERRNVEKHISEREPIYRDSSRQAVDKRSGKYESEPTSKEDCDRGRRNERSLRYESDHKPRENHDISMMPGRHVSEPNPREDRYKNGREEGSGRHESEAYPREDRDRRGREERSGRHESERNGKDDYDRRSGEKRLRLDEDSTSFPRRR